MRRNHSIEEDTWEFEQDMTENYPYLFKDSGTQHLLRFNTVASLLSDNHAYMVMYR